MANIRPISHIPDNELPFSKRTIYRYHCEKRYPKLIFKVGSRLCFDFDEWERMAAEAKKSNVQMAEKIHRL